MPQAVRCCNNIFARLKVVFQFSLSIPPAAFGYFCGKTCEKVQPGYKQIKTRFKNHIPCAYPPIIVGCSSMHDS